MSVSLFLDLLPCIAIVLELVALIVHLVVAHRLKCEKSLLECFQTCLPAFMKCVEKELASQTMLEEKEELAEVDNSEEAVLVRDFIKWLYSTSEKEAESGD